MLVKQMDENADGVLTMEEWENCLQPKINAQKEYITLMKGFTKCNDPLLIEEEILDMTFKKRALDKENKVMRKQQNANLVWRQKK